MSLILILHLRTRQTTSCNVKLKLRRRVKKLLHEMQSYFLRNSFSRANITTRKKEKNIIGEQQDKQTLSSFSLSWYKNSTREICEIEKKSRKSSSNKQRKLEGKKSFAFFFLIFFFVIGQSSSFFNGRKYF